MNQSLILDLLENNARLSSQDLADILNEDEASIKSEIQSLENLWLSHDYQLQQSIKRPKSLSLYRSKLYTN